MWDPDLAPEDVEIEGDYLKHGDSLIPMHRIREIRRLGNVVRSRDK